MRCIVTGAAGFIGSHLVDRLLARGYSVTGIDNLVRGSREHLHEALAHPGFSFVVADVARLDERSEIAGCFDTIWHLAANSDIAAGVSDSEVDLQATFMSTVGALRLARRLGIPKFYFTSSSAVFGEFEGPIHETSGPMAPISNYGAMKLASEAAISAAEHDYLQRAVIFRLPNVVGTRTTHGLVHDLFEKIESVSDVLEVLGDGRQCKQYMHVSEVLEAMMFVEEHATSRSNLFHIAPADEGTTVAEIVEIVKRASGCSVPTRYTGGDRGWKGDVPKFQYSAEKLRRFGWESRLNSKEAVARACEEIVAAMRSIKEA
jgi:UDP-glucose 4-epimerase